MYNDVSTMSVNAVGDDATVITTTNRGLPTAIPTLYPLGLNDQLSATWTQSCLGSYQYFICNLACS